MSDMWLFEACVVCGGRGTVPVAPVDVEDLPIEITEMPSCANCKGTGHALTEKGQEVAVLMTELEALKRKGVTPDDSDDWLRRKERPLTNADRGSDRFERSLEYWRHESLKASRGETEE